jgi:addiction module HigA family antidote
MTPVHPGEILSEEFLEPRGISHAAIANGLNLPEQEIDEIVQGKRRIDAETALRLARYFSNSAQFWFGMQMQYELDTAYATNGEKIRQEVGPCRQEA